MELRVPHVTIYARAPSSLFIVSAECALPTNASLFKIFARNLANAILASSIRTPQLRGITNKQQRKSEVAAGCAE